MRLPRLPKRGHGPLIPFPLYRIVVQVLVVASGAYGLVQAGLILTGDLMRWSGPSYARALAVPYAPASWGWFAGAAGVLILGGHLFRRTLPIGVGLSILALWSGFFAIQFSFAALDSPRAGVTGPPTYLVLCVVLAAAAVCYLYPTVGRIAARRNTSGAGPTRED